jgi:hypothetical protein
MHGSCHALTHRLLLAVQRLFKVRAWRSSLSPAQAAQWMGAGVLGRGGLRSLVPNHFSPQLEQALAEAMKGGDR